MAQIPTRVFFAGGGTAGHLFPGLAVADRLAELLPDAQITFVGSGKRSERGHVMSAGFDYLALPCRPAPRRLGEWFSSLLENYAGYRTALRILDEDSASIVVGLGGYASVPMARAAARRNIPLVLIEQNALAGRATRWLAGSAMMVCASFDEVRATLPPKCNILMTGNPLRREFEGCSPSDPTVKRQIVVLGGSQGARALNENVPRALYKNRAQLAGWQIVHQSGEADCPSTAELYQKLGLEARVVPFLTDVPMTLASTGLAVCRAGGTTLAELAATGVPAVVVPYPHATDDHQQKNAAVLAAAGAALVVDERWSSTRLDDHLTQAIAQLLASPEKRRQMSAAMTRWARPNAARDVAALLRELIVTRSIGLQK
jgi:UDP-N-acetylglucosamine--N-acetylmuramyl-(pentapeptide) pyrophosphoryl-undecaprenol N-acetylglucosamine transferase